MRSSPPHEVPVREPDGGEGAAGGGYDARLLRLRRELDEDADGGVGRLNERDSSSWKCSVGNVSPLMRLIAIEPSIQWSERADDREMRRTP